MLPLSVFAGWVLRDHDCGSVMAWYNTVSSSLSSDKAWVWPTSIASSSIKATFLCFLPHTTSIYFCLTCDTSVYIPCAIFNSITASLLDPVQFVSWTFLTGTSSRSLFATTFQTFYFDVIFILPGKLWYAITGKHVIHVVAQHHSVYVLWNQLT